MKEAPGEGLLRHQTTGREAMLHDNITQFREKVKPDSRPAAAPLDVKLWADLSAAAFKKKATIELTMWHCLRAINSWGSGFLDTDFAIDSLCKHFNYSARTAYRHLSRGDGLFWTLPDHYSRPRIRIKALRAVCEYLDTYLPGDKHCREVKAADFNTLLKRRSQLYASLHKPKGIKSNPICRDTLTGLTGLHKVQQRRYEVQAKVCRTANFEVIQTGDGSYQLSRHLVVSKTRQSLVPRRLGNIYHSQQEPGHKGQTGKVSKALKPRRSSMSEGALARFSRTYFTGLRRLVAHLKRHKYQDYGHYLVRNNNRLREGRLEWCIHSM